MLRIKYNSQTLTWKQKQRCAWLGLFKKREQKNQFEVAKMATVTKVPVCYKSALYCYKSALLLQKCPIECYKSAPIRLQKCPGLQKFPTLVTKVPYRVTKVPFFGYKSAHSYGSLSPSASLSLHRYRLALLQLLPPFAIICPFLRGNAQHVVSGSLSQWTPCTPTLNK